MPRIRRRLTRIEPTSDAWTMRMWFLTRAMLYLVTRRQQVDSSGVQKLDEFAVSKLT
jgi:hypothetical protein